MKSQIYETLDDLLSELDSREVDVIKKRFGIENEPLSLEKIGKEYGITRERVRQIEEKALKKIIDKASRIPFFEKILHPTIDELLGHLKLKSENFVHKQLEEIHNLKEEKRILRLYFYIYEKIFYKKEDKLYQPSLSTHKEFFEKGLKILHHLHLRILKKKTILFKEDELIENLLKEIKTHFNIQPPIEEILEFLKISKIIKKNPLNEYGYFKNLRISPSSLAQKIELVFELEKKPLHFSEVYKKLLEFSESEDELLSDTWKKKYNPHSIHNVLLLDKKWVKYGRGKYVLKEWGYEEGHAIDLIRRVLEANKEMDIDELYNFVKKHKEISYNTFKLYLYKYFKIKNNKVYLKNG